MIWRLKSISVDAYDSDRLELLFEDKDTGEFYEIYAPYTEVDLQVGDYYTIEFLPIAVRVDD